MIKTPTYATLRNRKEANWYSEEMEVVLSSKLEESNSQYGIIRKVQFLKKNIDYEAKITLLRDLLPPNLLKVIRMVRKMMRR